VHCSSVAGQLAAHSPWEIPVAQRLGARSLGSSQPTYPGESQAKAEIAWCHLSVSTLRTVRRTGALPQLGVRDLQRAKARRCCAIPSRNLVAYLSPDRARMPKREDETTLRLFLTLVGRAGAACFYYSTRLNSALVYFGSNGDVRFMRRRLDRSPRSR